MKKLLIVALCLALSCLASAKEKTSMNYSRHVLSNGMQVYLSENPETPVIYTEMVIRAGSKHDPAKSQGIAHYLEHMFFKGSENIGTVNYAAEKIHLDRITELFDQHKAEKDPIKKKAILKQISKESTLAAEFAIPNEFDSLYQGMGAAKLNAHTSLEETVYKVEIPSNCLEKWASLESDRFRNPVFRLFQTELESVYEEKNRAMDNAMRAHYNAFMKLAFKNHQYGQQTTLGSVEDLKNPSIKDMYTFYRNYYVAENMVLILSGDFKTNEILPILEKHFSKIQSRPTPRFIVKKEQPFAGEERIDINFPGEESIMLAFRTVPKGHKDEAALMMIDMLLDNRTTGLININLNQKQKVLNAGSYPRFMNDHGLQAFYGSPLKDQKLEEVRDLILQQLELIKNGNFDADVMAGIINDFDVDFERRLEENVGRADIIREAVVSGLPLKERLAMPEKLATITREEVMLVARRYFGKNYAFVCRLDKEREIVKMPKPQFDPIKINRGRSSDLAQQVRAIKTTPIKPQYLDFNKDIYHNESADGIKVYAVKNPINSLFSLSLIFDKGSAHDKILPHLKNYLSLLGTKSKSPEEFQKALYALAISFNTESTYRTTSFSIEGPQKNFAAGLALINELLEKPKHDEKTLARFIDSRLAHRTNNIKDPATLENAANSFARLEEKSPFVNVIPNGDLKKLTVADFDHALQALRQSFLTVHYTGPEEGHTIQAQLHKLLTKRKRLALRPETFRQPAPIDKTEIFFLHQPQLQAKIRLFFSGKKFNAQNSFKAEIYNEYFDGSLGSIVFQEIRESRALAYSAWARYFATQHTQTRDIFMAMVGTQADKSVEAISVLKDIVFELPKIEKRFTTTRNALLNKAATERVPFRQKLNQYRVWCDQGFTSDPRVEKNEIIKNITFEELLKFHEQEIASQNHRLVVVGDRTKIDLNKLASVIGPVREIKVEELFAY